MKNIAKKTDNKLIINSTQPANEIKKPLLRAICGSSKTPLVFGNISIPCYVLEDGTAVLSGRGMQNILGFSRTGGGDRLIKLVKNDRFCKYASPELIQSLDNPLKFIRTDSGGAQPETNGYEATLMIDICYVFIDAKNDGVLMNPQELSIAMQAQAVERAFSKTGIVSVIYKLTGYLDNQVANFLNDILNKFLLDEAKRYAITYPIELYKQWFRLNNWEWKPESKQKRPGVLGHWTNDLIYSRMAPNLLQELEIKNPKNAKGYREKKHFQFLTDEVGEPRLREFFGGLIALAKASTTWRKYYAMVNRAYPKYNETPELPFPLDDE